MSIAPYIKRCIGLETILIGKLRQVDTSDPIRWNGEVRRRQPLSLNQVGGRVKRAGSAPYQLMSVIVVISLCEANLIRYRGHESAALAPIPAKPENVDRIRGAFLFCTDVKNQGIARLY